MCFSKRSPAVSRNVLVLNIERFKVGMRMSLTTKEINLNLDDIWHDSSLILKAYDLCSKDILIKDLFTKCIYYLNI